MITPNGTIIIPARLTFFHLLRPVLPKKAKPGAVPKFDVTVLVPHGSPEDIEWNAHIDQVMDSKWPGMNAPVTLKPTLQKNQRCWGDGATSLDAKLQPREGWTGHTYITARSETAPGVADPTTGVPIDPANLMAVQAQMQKFYSGCYVAVEINPYCWDNENGRGVSSELIGVMFMRDGDRMGNAAPAPTGFGAILGAPQPVANGVGQETPAQTQPGFNPLA
jgi:hypothetical protein